MKKQSSKRARTLVRTAKRMSSPASHPAKTPRHKGTVQAGQPDAVALLKADHKYLSSLLEDLKTAQAPNRRERVLTQVEKALKTHTKLEEEIFYPAFRNAAATKRDREMFYEATEEHHVVETVLPEVSRAVAQAEVFAARAKVLKEIVEHHAEEEETEMFPRARTLLLPAELKRLGEEMTERRRTLEHSTGPLGAVAALFSR